MERKVSDERLIQLIAQTEERMQICPADVYEQYAIKLSIYKELRAFRLNELSALHSSVKTVGVKKLEWADYEGGYRAKKPFGSSYYVQKLPSGIWDWNGLRCASADEAKAAAQADYERRILSAIEAPTPQEAPSEVTDAMVDAAHAVIERSYQNESWEFGPPSLLARSALTAALKGDRP